VAAGGISLLAAVALALVAAPFAQATSASTSWRLHGGDTFQINAWHCSTYVKACSWTASAKLRGSNPSKARWIKNRALLQAHGVSASITISKDSSGSLKMVSKSLGQVTWKNTHAWIADTSGTMKPSWTTAYVSTKSCGSALVTSSINVSEKCVYAGAA
jgi:hypothetical protein